MFNISGSNITNFANCSYIGFGSRASGSNQVQLGNASTSAYAYGSVQNRSDQRDKTDIRDTLLGLSFINALRPVDFRWDYREDYYDLDEVNKTMTPVTKDGSRKGTRFHHGFIAQEVKEVSDSQGIDFAGYQDHSINGGEDVLSIGYTELIGPLVKAVQELSARVQELENA